MAPSHGYENEFDHSNNEIREKKEMLYGVNKKRIYPVNKLSAESKINLLHRSTE